MIKAGLVSISFRDLPVAAVAAAAAEAGLRSVEWGGDVHVPHGDLKAAAAAKAVCADLGLETAAYGSYYRAGESPAQGLEFGTVLETAVALGAPTIRVWAGALGSAVADAAYRDLVAADLRRAADMASAAGVDVGVEYHGGTLTDDDSSARALLRKVGNLAAYWQPPVGMSPEMRKRSLAAVLGRLANLHVFHWRGTERLPLAEGRGEWVEYLRMAAADGRGRHALLEFAKDDSPGQMAADAKVLLGILEEVEIIPTKMRTGLQKSV